MSGQPMAASVHHSGPQHSAAAAPGSGHYGAGGATQSSQQSAPPPPDGEKLSARKARKEAERQKKQAKKYEEQLKKIRGPKSQKLQIIDESFLEKYRHVQSLPPGPTLKTKKRSKKAPTDVVQINLSECIREQLAGGERSEPKPIVPIVPQQPLLLLHKGKQREVPKEKKLSRLKKDIIRNREDKGAAAGQQPPGANEGKPQSTNSGGSVEQEKSANSGIVSKQSSEGTSQHNVVDSPFLKAIERCCINDGLPPSRDSSEYQNGFPSLRVSAAVSKPTTLRHSRSFRPYCDHFISEELRELAEDVVVKLFNYQTKAYAKNPIKAVANKRYVVGFNEVLKLLELRKVRLVLVAPDLEPNETIDQMVSNVKMLCRQSQVPYLFALKRRKIGFHLLKKAPISCVGVLSYAGCEDTVKQMLLVVEQERESYRNLMVVDAPC
ncbi:selenocysteine insertion sequence-binding protein 2 [Anopheles stephensi]|uniref:selenocysteine insertion sequence-binding protein 2 n=1 Tax=Anopheles stephensi TaxID=30069 RepID=UPI0016587500|nr:selenocysteine insertion sequence-binding protein 2 [Anopheles stephensi]